MSLPTILLVPMVLVMGIVVGWLVTWLYFSLQVRRANARIAALETQLSHAPHATSTVANAAMGAAPTAATARPATTVDDLTAVDGIGPKIAGLLNADGITTWRTLSTTDLARLHRILDSAGPRYRSYDPESWPRQAAELMARSSPAPDTAPTAPTTSSTTTMAGAS
jgi:predicted flap endonuclease-1-like 5' DNA nuclease